MSIMYNFLLEENERLRKEVDAFKEFLYVTEVACSHLLQDGDVTTQGVEVVERLLLLSKELQVKYDKEAEFRRFDS
jgi:hypothetical protein